MVFKEPFYPKDYFIYGNNNNSLKSQDRSVWFNFATP